MTAIKRGACRQTEGIIGKAHPSQHLDVSIDDAEPVAVVHRDDELLEELTCDVLRQRRALRPTQSQNIRFTVVHSQGHRCCSADESNTGNHVGLAVQMHCWQMSFRGATEQEEGCMGASGTVPAPRDLLRRLAVT
jgi:hypothetical protein